MEHSKLLVVGCAVTASGGLYLYLFAEGGNMIYAKDMDKTTDKAPADKLTLEKGRMSKCSTTDTEHCYIPISWSVSTTSKHVTVIMCTRCFYRSNIEDISIRYPAKI